MAAAHRSIAIDVVTGLITRAGTPVLHDAIPLLPAPWSGSGLSPELQVEAKEKVENCLGRVLTGLRRPSQSDGRRRLPSQPQRWRTPVGIQEGSGWGLRRGLPEQGPEQRWEQRWALRQEQDSEQRREQGPEQLSGLAGEQREGPCRGLAGGLGGGLAPGLPPGLLRG
jgi:hypothetical protein